MRPKVKILYLLPSEIKEDDIIYSKNELGMRKFDYAKKRYTWIHRHPYISTIIWGTEKKFFDHDKEKFYVVRIE
jgi:hypothetical protein